MKQEILKGGSDSLYLGLMDHGRAVTPATCTIRILDGSTVLESGTATDGVYAPTSETTGECHEDLVAEWSYTLTGSAVTYKRVETFDVVLFKLYPVVTDEDLVREAPCLGAGEYVYNGEVTGTSASGLVDSQLLGRLDDWVGAVLRITSGTYIDTQYVVTGYTSSSGTIAYSAANYPSISDTYTLRRSYQGEVDAAWYDVKDKLEQACASAEDGSRPYLIMTPDRLRRVHLMRALEKVYRGMADDVTGADWAKAEYYKAEFDSAWSGLKLKFAARADIDDPVVVNEGSTFQGFSR